MKYLTKHITALLLMVSLTVGFSGIQVFHHVCTTSGVHLVSIIGEKDCALDKQRNTQKEKVEVIPETEKSCCSQNVEQEIPVPDGNEGSCCAEGEQDNNSSETNDNGSAIDNKCCTNYSQFIALDDIFVVTNYFQDNVLQPIIATVADNPIFTDISQQFKLLAEKVPKFIKFPDKLIRYIHLITKHRSGNQSDEPDLVF
jgi:hypothetical protein